MQSLSVETEPPKRWTKSDGGGDERKKHLKHKQICSDVVVKGWLKLCVVGEGERHVWLWKTCLIVKDKKVDNWLIYRNETAQILRNLPPTPVYITLEINFW